MEFIRVREVKKPRKQVKCYMCLKEISGEHMYVSGKADDFFYYRTHKHCFQTTTEMCSNCSYRNDCQSDVGECFHEYTRENR